MKWQIKFKSICKTTSSSPLFNRINWQDQKVIGNLFLFNQNVEQSTCKPKEMFSTPPPSDNDEPTQSNGLNAPISESFHISSSCQNSSLTQAVLDVNTPLSLKQENYIIPLWE